MSRKTLVLFVLILTLSTASEGQNLVINPDMEDTISSGWPACGPCLAVPWFQPLGGSPDCFNFTWWVNHIIPPPNYPEYYDLGFGYQLPRSGYAFMGIATFQQFQTNGREYIEGVLSDTLVAGHKYCVSFFTSLSNNSGRAIANLGLKFYNDSANSSALLLGQLPHIEATQFIEDTLNWIEISGEYYANGGEKYFVIGNLRMDSSTSVITVIPETILVGQDEEAYYYIDDVSVIDCTVGLEEHNDVTQLQFSPNPTSGEMEFDLEISQQSLAEVLDITGRVVLKQELERGGKRHNIDMKALPGGVYLVRVLAGGRPLAAGRVVKM